MFAIRTKSSTKLEDAIDSALTELDGHTAETDEFEKVVDQIVKLHTLKQADKPQRPSYDALIGAASSIIGIAMIIKHEETAVLTSKAISMFRFGK